MDDRGLLGGSIQAADPTVQGKSASQVAMSVISRTLEFAGGCSATKPRSSFRASAGPHVSTAKRRTSSQEALIPDNALSLYPLGSGFIWHKSITQAARLR